MNKMKYLKIYEDFDFNEDDFDFEEEDENSIDGKILIFRYVYDGCILIGKYNESDNNIILLRDTLDFTWDKLFMKTLLSRGLNNTEIDEIVNGKVLIETAGSRYGHKLDELIDKVETLDMKDIVFVDNNIRDKIMGINENFDLDPFGEEDWDEKDIYFPNQLGALYDTDANGVISINRSLHVSAKRMEFEFNNRQKGIFKTNLRLKSVYIGNNYDEDYPADLRDKFNNDIYDDFFCVKFDMKFKGKQKNKIVHLNFYILFEDLDAHIPNIKFNLYVSLNPDEIIHLYDSMNFDITINYIKDFIKEKSVVKWRKALMMENLDSNDFDFNEDDFDFEEEDENSISLTDKKFVSFLKSNNAYDKFMYNIMNYDKYPMTFRKWDDKDYCGSLRKNEYISPLSIFT